MFPTFRKDAVLREKQIQQLMKSQLLKGEYGSLGNKIKHPKKLKKIGKIVQGRTSLDKQK